jgi:molybdopterin synthase catalytic subunit
VKTSGVVSTLTEVTTAKADDLDWVGFGDETIPVSQVLAWIGSRDCGALTTFSGIVRENSEGRPPIVAVEYDAYREHLGSRLLAIVDAARRRWPDLGRIAVMHRLGRLVVGETSVFVAVASPHRNEAFEASRFLIDTVKTSAPIWKCEHWRGGSDWALSEHALVDVEGE